jgi:carboxymethylenebutenolidase
MATTVTFKRPDGQIIQGYLAEPEHAAGAAAVVVIQEWCRARARPLPRQVHG